MAEAQGPRDPLPLAPATADELERAERAALARGDAVENLDWIAFMFFSHGRHDKARTYYAQLCERVTSNASYRWYLGCALAAGDDRAGARAQWERVTQLDRGEYARLAAARLAAP